MLSYAGVDLSFSLNEALNKY